MWFWFQDEYVIPDTSRKTTIKGMAEPWRRLKFELRRDYYDTCNTHQERLLNVPPEIKEEDWVAFCEYEKTPEAVKSRVDHKRKREGYKYSHTSGRKPHSRVKRELVKNFNYS